MGSPFPPDEPALDRWAVPLDEPAPADPAPPPAAGPPDPEPPDVLRFGPDPDPYPSEGYHPRLRRFGDAA
jgi:hypothetical protein